ncbi:MAG: hypothetical protein P1R58_01170 [bacterium]|nr:hypothetical protein [bacterium]
MRSVWILTVFALISLAVVVGCSDDYVLPPDSVISGKYEGVYVVTEDYGSSQAQEHTQFIVFEFIDSSSTYIMRIDTEKDFDPTFSVCRVDGKFLFTDGVTLLQLHSLPDEQADQNACDRKFNPEGLFTLIKSGESDSLRLTQFDNAAKVFKEIRIGKVASE